MKLEELARQSSDAARASVVHLDPPPIGERPARSPWRMPALVGAAALVLVAVVGSLVWTGGNGSQDDSLLSGAPEVPRLGLPELSSYKVISAIELSELASEDLSVLPRFEYYGAPDAEDPYANGDLLVVVLPDASAAGDPSLEGQSVPVRGTTGYDVSRASGLPGGVTLLQWTEPGPPGPAPGFMLGSRTRSVAELAEIAEELRVEPPVTEGQLPTITIPESLGLDRIASARSVPFLAIDPAAMNTDGFLVAYEGPTSDSALVLTSRAGQLDDEVPALRFWATTTEDVSVNGRPGFEVAIEFPSEEQPMTVRTVAWAPGQGLVASLTATGGDPDIDLAALAATVRKLDDATWEQYRALAAESAIGAADFDEVYGSGAGDVGNISYSWALGVQDGSLCLTIGSGGGSSGTCLPRDNLELSPEVARTLDNGFGPEIAHVLIAADPSVETVAETSGIGTMGRVEAAGYSWFVWIGDSDHQPSFEVVVDGQVSRVLEAAVEELAVAEPGFDVAGHPTAQSIGITEDFELLVTGREETIAWALGRVGQEMCLLTEGEAVTASCLPDNDLIVFRPPGLTEGVDTSHIVIQDVPACLELNGIDQVTTISSMTFADGDDIHDVWSIPGEADGWRLFLTDPADGEEVWVDLPDLEGSAAWPAGLCDR